LERSEKISKNWADFHQENYKLEAVAVVREEVEAKQAVLAGKD
jgi:hypothetical protein